VLDELNLSPTFSNGDGDCKNLEIC